MPEKLVPIKLGDTKVIGEKEYELHEDGNHLLMQVASAEARTYTATGLLGERKRLLAELAEVDSLLAKHGELLAARVAGGEPE